MTYITQAYDISSFIKNIKHEDLSNYNITALPYNAELGNGAKLPLSLKYIDFYGISAHDSSINIIYDGSMSSWRNINKDEYWCNFDFDGYNILTVICTDGEIKYREIDHKIQEVS